MNKNRIDISVVIPCFRCSNTIPGVVKRIKKIMQKLGTEYEIIFVNDCSPDNDWEIIVNESIHDSKIRGISLSRNFGQHYAISAGLSISEGNRVVVMDGDLQDQPEEIANLYNKALEGFQIVQARRIERKDKFAKKLFSITFYKVLSWLTGVKYDPAIANFGIYSREVIDAINALPENIRYFPAMVKWVGFSQTCISVHHSMRSSGGSSYNIKKLLRLALDIMLAYSDKPIRLTIKAGFLITFLSLIVSIIIFIKWISGNILVSGYTSLILSVWLLSGLIIFILGIIGLYIGKTFEGVKNRPTFIISKKTWEGKIL